MSKHPQTGEQFIHKSNPNIHRSKEVEDVVEYLKNGFPKEDIPGERIPNDPQAKLRSYLGFLANREIVNDGILTGDKESITRQIEHRVIKPDEVPESYFDAQARIAKERGQGDVQFDEEMRRQMIEAIQADQRASLERWAEYISGPDGDYPNWFETYVWDSVGKLGVFDKEKGKFNKRESSTVAPYPELNREALAYVYDKIAKSFEADMSDEDEKLVKLIRDGNFGKLYIHALSEAGETNELLKTTEGSWKKFDKTDDPRTARRLSESLRGFATGWCTAGEESAKRQLSNGDFYVYYSRDEKGEDTVPRIAIRMSDYKVAEVRGIMPGQELEPDFYDLAKEQLTNLAGGDKYFKKLKDMKRLTAVYNSYKNNPDVEFNFDDLMFIYEIRTKIVGFGHEEDPRIKELKNNRDTIKDYNEIFSNIEEFEGDVDLRMLKTVKNLTFPIKEVKGDINLSRTNAIEDCKLPETVEGSVMLGELISIKRLKLPSSIGGSLNLRRLKSSEGLELPITIGGNLDLHALTSAEGLTFPEAVGGKLDLHALTSAEGLTFPEAVGGKLDLERLTSAENLKFPKKVGGDLSAKLMVSAKNITLPEFVGGSLNLRKLTSAENLTFPKEVKGSLRLKEISSAQGLVLPESVGGNVRFDGLKSAVGLVLPETIGGDIRLTSLTSAEGLKLPQTVNGDLYLNSLISAQGLVLPETIGGKLILNVMLKDDNNLLIPDGVEVEWYSEQT